MSAQPIDLRRGHDGLCALVRAQLKLDPYAGHLFVFMGKRRDRIKILFWDKGGFVIYYKRFEKGRFQIPMTSNETITLDATTLAMILDGIDISHLKRRPLWSPPSAISAI